MTEQDLRDRSGNLVGRIKTQYDGVLELRDKYGNLKGRYDPRQNETRDVGGNLFARGNMLAALL